MARQRRAHQRQDRRRQPVARLGVMGDAVQEFVRPGADMVIDEMRGSAVDQKGRKPQKDQDEPGADSMDVGCYGRAAKSSGASVSAARQPISLRKKLPCQWMRDTAS